jgi:hypothetical protein
LPLETSAADLDDILGPGSYRFEIVDEEGDVLDFVVSVKVGEESTQPADSGAPVPALGGRSSDLRAVLEANVQMARSLADAVRVLSGAQADWVKGLAVAKAIPRNAPPPPRQVAVPPPPPPEPSPQATPKSDSDESDEEPTWYERVIEIIGPENLPAVFEAVGGLADRFIPSKPKAASGEDDAKPSPRNASPAEPEADMPLDAKIDAVKSRLTPDEVKIAEAALKTISPTDLAGLAAKLGPMPVDSAVEFVRDLINGGGEEADADAGGSQ